MSKQIKPPAILSVGFRVGEKDGNGTEWDLKLEAPERAGWVFQS
jgi:hypothetical protein